MREIASGGFGAVYLTKVVHADGFSRLAAVKLLHRRWSENEEIARRMRDEARLLGWLRHRNIVDVVDLTSIDGRAAVVMEYLEAVDLKFIIGQMANRSERLPASAVMDVMSSVASALDAAYNRPPYPGERPLHVIHRDIKPSNIMIDETGLVKVLDFGVARADFDARESQTKELQFGSVDYMPPERLFFEPETPASDIYSLGATMYEVLTQEKLGKAKGRPERHARFLADRFSYMRAAIGLGGQDATEVERLLTRCLAFEHQNRPPAAEVMKLARKVGRALPGPSLADWAEDHCGELIRLQEEQPRSPSPLTDSILTEDSKAFGVSQGKVEVSMDEAIEDEPPQTDEGPHVEIEDDDDDSDIVEPVPEKPPWMFEETREDSPSEAHLLRNEALDEDRFTDEAAPESAPAPFGEGGVPFLDEPGGWAPQEPAESFESPEVSQPPEVAEPPAPSALPEPPEPSDTAPSPELRNNPTIIPELGDLPPLPEPAGASPFVEEIDPDLMATRVGPSPMFSSSEEEVDDPTLARTPEADEDEPPPPDAPPPSTPVAPVVDSIPGFEPSLDDWDDVPTRIEAEPTKEPKSGAAKVSGSVVSVLDEANPPPPPVVPATHLPGQETALMPTVPPPDLQEGDDSTQLMPSDAPPPPPMASTQPPPPMDGPPAAMGQDEPMVFQTE